MTLSIEKSILHDKKNALIPITPELLPLLQRVLSKQKTSDPFLKSVSYLAMTGRRGLWLFGNNESAMVICKHPNLKEDILFFPPFGNEAISLIHKALAEDRFINSKIDLARLTSDHKNIIQHLVKDGFSKPHREKTLDWNFPVHILSNEKIINHAGPEFRSFRNRIHRAAKVPFTGRTINLKQDKDTIIGIASKWASSRSGAQFCFEDLIGPTLYVLSLMEEETLEICGVIIHEKSEGRGFWIWEEDRENNMAYSLVRISIGKRGAAEFGALKMADILQERQIGFMCTGGSETKTLDDFKRKFNPVSSIEMKTMNLRDGC